jgi:hypothetical protein
MRSPVRVFGFVSIQLLALDRGFKLGFAAKNLLVYVFVQLTTATYLYQKLLKTF